MNRRQLPARRCEMNLVLFGVAGLFLVLYLVRRRARLSREDND